MARRHTFLALAVAAVVVAVACSQEAPSPVSPSTAGGATAAAADGTTLKVTAPTPIAPVNGQQLTSQRPVFNFSNAAGRFTSVPAAYRLEVLDNGGTLVAARTVPQADGGSTSYTLDVDLAGSTEFTWRTRAEYDGQPGPWSANATFKTPVVQVVTPTPTPGGGPNELPFPVPASCGPGFDPGNRVACASDISRLSAEWPRCVRGDEVGCGRFVRQVIFALRTGEPNAWRNIQAAPGGSACNCNVCGPSDGTMLRSDTTVWNGQRTFDLIGGSGAPNPTLYWNQVTNYRAVDSLVVAPLCP